VSYQAGLMDRIEIVATLTTYVLRLALR
jgi:hypothetical protein